jgi:maltose-binding protein MalE
LKKLMMLTALLAMLAVAAIPAIAQVTQETEQEGESADLDQDFSATQEGDNSTQCAAIQGVGNTGNAQNVTDIIQYASEADEFEFEEVGSTIDVSPTNTTDCTSEVNQAASASG